MNKLKIGVITQGVVNACIAVYIFNSGGSAGELKGFLVGMALAIMFGMYKIMQVKKIMAADPRASVLMMMMGLVVRMFLLIVFFMGGFFLLKMDILYFAGSLVFGMVLNMVAEVWHMNTIKAKKSK